MTARHLRILRLMAQQRQREPRNYEGSITAAKPYLPTGGNNTSSGRQRAPARE